MASNKYTPISTGRPPRALLRAALRGEAKGYETQQAVHKLARESRYHFPISQENYSGPRPPLYRKEFTVADLDPKLIKHLEEIERNYQYRHHRAVTAKCRENPTYLAPYLAEARQELDAKINAMEKELRGDSDNLSNFVNKEELEKRAYMNVLTQAYEEGHAFDDNFPFEDMEQARAEALDSLLQPIIRVQEKRIEAIGIMRKVYDTQVLGLAFQKAVAAEKESEKQQARGKND